VLDTRVASDGQGAGPARTASKAAGTAGCVMVTAGPTPAAPALDRLQPARRATAPTAAPMCAAWCRNLLIGICFHAILPQVAGHPMVSRLEEAAPHRS